MGILLKLILQSRVKGFIYEVVNGEILTFISCSMQCQKLTFSVGSKYFLSGI